LTADHPDWDETVSAAVERRFGQWESDIGLSAAR